MRAKHGWDDAGMPNMSGRKKTIWSWKGWPPVAAVVLFLAAWQGFVILFQVEKWLLPGPVDVFREAAGNWQRLWMHTKATLMICLPGFAASVAGAVGLALLMHRFETLKRAFAPLIVISQNVPTIILAPLLAAWFGYGLFPKLVVVFLVCFFPIAVSMLDGLKETDPAMKNYMRMIGASRRQLLFKLELPHALPFLFSGLKISATYSVLGAVIAEWVGSTKREGLMLFLNMTLSAFDLDRAMTAILMIVIVSLAFYGLIGLIEKLVIRWKPAREEKA
jgi:ABC-type nitrate/sulfonate/bicarbonate transport system permease component